MRRSSRTRPLSMREWSLSSSSGESSDAGGERTGRKLLVLTSVSFCAGASLAQAASERHVRTSREDVHGSAVAVEGGVEHRLVVDAERHLLRQGEPVEELAEDLDAVCQSA